MERSRKREVCFRDKYGILTKVEISTVGKHLSMSGERAGCYGQIYDDIKPRTNTQEKLIDIWKECHLKNADEVPILWSEMEDIMNTIEKEEKDYTNEMRKEGYDYDLTNDIDDFILVGAVEDVMGVSESRAKRIIAVARYMDEQFGIGGYLCDIRNIEFDGAEVEVMGVELLVGEGEELNDAAFDYLVNDKEYWREAVYSGATELGLEKWAEEVVDEDGWFSVLSRYGGSAESYNVCGDWIEVGRK